MRAMVMHQPNEPLTLETRPDPEPKDHQVLLRVGACGICRTDLHVLDGELPDPKLPLILGHQIVGRIEKVGSAVDHLQPGDRVGVPWLGHTCGECSYCRRDQENLCDRAQFTGYQLDGGFAERAVADARYAFKIPETYDDLHAAPLLCAGLIGYRAYRMVGEAEKIGLYGFGAAAHLMTQIARHHGREIHAFVRPGDRQAMAFAKKMGAAWAGPSDQPAREPLDAAILFAPVGDLVPQALESVRKGGVVVCAGIHMSEIPAMDYQLLWGERVLRSVANLKRSDGIGFFKEAAEANVRTHVQAFDLQEANTALKRLRDGKIDGAAVLRIGGEES